MTDSVKALSEIYALEMSKKDQEIASLKSRLDVNYERISDWRKLAEAAEQAKDEAIAIANRHAEYRKSAEKECGEAIEEAANYEMDKVKAERDILTIKAALSEISLICLRVIQ